MEAKAQPSKRRSWGKSKEREKVMIVDQMEIEALTKSPLPATSEKDSPHDVSSSLLHPHLMSDHQLESILREMKVPILDSAKNESRRDQLLCLFKRHVVPKPQRAECLSEGKGKRKRRGVLHDEQESDTTTSGDDSAMEWTATAEERTGLAGNSEQSRKRKSLEQLLPPTTKKASQSFISPLSSTQPMTGSDAVSQAMPPLKRPSIPQDGRGKILKMDKTSIHSRPHSIPASSLASTALLPPSRSPANTCRPKITWP